MIFDDIRAGSVVKSHHKSCTVSADGRGQAPSLAVIRKAPLLAIRVPSPGLVIGLGHVGRCAALTAQVRRVFSAGSENTPLKGTGEGRLPLGDRWSVGERKSLRVWGVLSTSSLDKPMRGGMFDLNGRTALVTGASGGIGGAIARALARQGARVAVSGTRVEALSSLATELGAAAEVLPADLSQPGAAEGLIKAAVGKLGSVDILVSNAGMTRDGLAMRLSEGDWADVLAVNLTAGFQLMRAAIRVMMKNRWGRIVAITSVVAATGNAGQVNYAAAKAGTTGLIKSLAQEIGGRGITANCVAPGFIETEMTKDIDETRRQAVLARVALARLGRPEDVAGCVAFLASEEAGYITGQTIHVNGGLAMV